MAWVKIPQEHHPLFLAALPRDPAIETIRMFGGIAAMVNGNMFGGLFGRSVLVRVNAADQATVLAMDGGAPFDPMGNGRTMKDTVMLPESVMGEPRELARWLDRALAFAKTLPPKAKKKKKTASRGAKKPAKAKAKAKHRAR